MSEAANVPGWVGAGLLAVASALPAPAAADDLGLRTVLSARVVQADGRVDEIEVGDGAMLRTGDELQVRVRTERDGYVYVLAYGSTGTPLLLHPFSGEASAAFVSAGGERPLPEPDLYLPLDGNIGEETIVVIPSERPLADVAGLLSTIRRYGQDRASAVREVRWLYPDAQVIEFRHVDAGTVVDSGVASRSVETAEDPPVAAVGGSPRMPPGAPDMGSILDSLPPAPGATAAGPPREGGVLSASGSRIRALLEGRSPETLEAERRVSLPDASRASPGSTPEVVPERSSGPDPAESSKRKSLAGRIGGWLRRGKDPGDEPSVAEGAPDDEAVAPVDPAARTIALQSAAAGEDASSSRFSTLSSQVAKASDSGEGAQSPRSDLPAGEQAAPGMAPVDVPPPRAPSRVPASSPAIGNGSDGASVASPLRATGPAATLDLLRDESLGAALVLVITPSGSGPGVVVNRAGHVLTTWHLVGGLSRVSVLLNGPGGLRGASKQSRAANVVRLQRFSDLALLEVENPPSGLAFATLAPTTALQPGAVVHVLSPEASGSWAHQLGTIERVRSGASWYSGRQVLHQATLMNAQIPQAVSGGGAALFDDELRLVGLGISGAARDEPLSAIAADTLRRFVPPQAPG